MTNKAAILVVAGLLLISALDQFLYFGHPMVKFSHTLALVVALIMMLANGTFTDRKYFTLAYALIGAVGLGITFKILHWTGADQILIVSVSSLVILYGIHFATKAPKRILDILKLITVLSSATAMLITSNHWVYDPWSLKLGANVIFWTTFIWFMAEGIHKKQLFTKENP